MCKRKDATFSWVNIFLMTRHQQRKNHHINLNIQSDDALQHETYGSDTARQLRWSCMFSLSLVSSGEFFSLYNVLVSSSLFHALVYKYLLIETIKTQNGLRSENSLLWVTIAKYRRQPHKLSWLVKEECLTTCTQRDTREWLPPVWPKKWKGRTIMRGDEGHVSNFSSCKWVEETKSFLRKNGAESGVSLLTLGSIRVGSTVCELQCLR
jgi:hypothetical protein